MSRRRSRWWRARAEPPAGIDQDLGRACRRRRAPSRCTPGSLDGCSTTAPAPSPNRTQVVRSVKSRTRDSTSAPITRTVSACAGLDERGRRRHPVGEAGARGVDVEGRGRRRRACAGSTRRSRGSACRRCSVAHDDQVELLGRDPGASRALARGLEREVGRGLAVVGEAARLDAGPVADPLVAGVDEGLEPGVGDDAVRQDASPTPAMVAWRAASPRALPLAAADRRRAGRDASGRRADARVVPAAGPAQGRRRPRASRRHRPSARHHALRELRQDVAGPGLDERVGAGVRQSLRARRSHRTGETTCRSSERAQLLGRRRRARP